MTPGPTPPQVGVLIESDGTPAGTHVRTDDGTELRNIVAVDWHLEVGEQRATATITIGDVPVHLAGRLDVRPHPTRRDH